MDEAADIARLRQGLWDCAVECGIDTDGVPGPQHLAYPDIVEFALSAVRTLRADYDEVRDDLWEY